MKIIECIPNFSEGRDENVLDELKACFTGDRLRLIHFTADIDHNRSVATVAGEPHAVAEALMRAVGTAAGNIDLRRHDGEHPFIGATDVVPFVPLSGMTEEEAVELSVRVAQGIAVAYEIPTYLYERSARRPQCVNLADVRKGGFQGLSERMKTLDFIPDFGPMRPHPTAGATAVGVRKFLIAYNINLNTSDRAVAARIARAIRERDGGMPCVKALGVMLESSGIAQVTTNLTDYRITSPAAVFRRVRELAEAQGVSVLGGELIGMVPREAAEGVSAQDWGLSYNLDERVIEIPDEWLSDGEKI